MIKEIIKTKLAEALAGYDATELVVELEHPKDEAHGDYATSVALGLAKKLGKSPMEIAKEIVSKVGAIDGAAKIEVAPPGFVNFTLTDEAILEAINADVGPNLGQNKRKVIVEYSSPNIAKPFSIGHLRSTIIGDAVANLLEATGWQVFRDNHLGDWGTQFGKEIYAIKTWGNEAAIEQAAEPVKELVALYVKFHEEAETEPGLEDAARAWSKKLEDGDPEARRLWQKCVDWSWREFNRLYDRLGVKFTENNGRGYGEAYFEAKMAPVVAELKEKNLLKESEGAQLGFFENDALPPLMIIRKDGATLYATRDLATDKFRLAHYGADIVVINETGIEQELHFQQLYKIEELLGWYKPGQRVHIKHGHWRFKERKMSTRKGDVIWLEEVLNEAVTRARKLISTSGTAREMSEPGQKALAEVVGIGALKWNDLKSGPQNNITFDWDEVLNMDGNSAPYMQYAHARACSILRAAGLAVTACPVARACRGLYGDLARPATTSSARSVPAALNEAERALARRLGRFNETVEHAAAHYAPNTLCNYLYDLAQCFSNFYQTQPVLKAQSSERDLRLYLVGATAQVIKNGLKLLGIKAPEKM